MPRADVLDVARPFPGRDEPLGVARPPSRRWRALCFATAVSAPSAASRRRSASAFAFAGPWPRVAASFAAGLTSSTSRGSSKAATSLSASPSHLVAIASPWRREALLSGPLGVARPRRGAVRRVRQRAGPFAISGP